MGKAKNAGSGRETAIADAMPPELIAELVRRHFPLTPVPSAPEISVHRAGPGSGLWRFAEADEAFGNPYWAHQWGGGLALAPYVLANPDIVAGKRVMDLGAGSGVVGIAAAKAGAAHVIAVDVDRYAIVAMQLNAEANGVSIAPLHADLLDGPAPDVDVMLVGDLFYEAELARRVSAFLARCRVAGIDVLVGDPLRAHLPRERLKLLAEYSGPDFGSSEMGTNAVFAFA